MLLGKRPRPALKRTTSMKDVAVELSTASEASKPSDLEVPRAGDGTQLPSGHGDWNSDRRQNLTAASPLSLSTLVSNGGMRRSSADYAAAVDAAPFLRACALCKGFLRSGRDIFMYRYTHRRLF
ncbi:hypothetical protein KSP39_PZI003007 [Platanthera zijinensis]|uniref:FLZ-type domain-containing protein n=1 Tax=Platanthera zijinensis TaxID=2320716 RepID=A0AAP0BWP0_9ASPA